MGSIGWNNEYRENREILREELGECKIVAESYPTDGGTAFIALRDPQDRFTYCLTCLIRRNGAGHIELKWMDEFVGPFVTGAPTSVMQALTPLHEIWAIGEPGLPTDPETRSWAERFRRDNGRDEQQTALFVA